MRVSLLCRALPLLLLTLESLTLSIHSERQPISARSSSTLRGDLGDETREMSVSHLPHRLLLVHLHTPKAGGSTLSSMFHRFQAEGTLEVVEYACPGWDAVVNDLMRSVCVSGLSLCGVSLTRTHSLSAVCCLLSAPPLLCRPLSLSLTPLLRFPVPPVHPATPRDRGGICTRITERYSWTVHRSRGCGTTSPLSDGRGSPWSSSVSTEIP